MRAGSRFSLARITASAIRSTRNSRYSGSGSLWNTEHAVPAEWVWVADIIMFSLGIPVIPPPAVWLHLAVPYIPYTNPKRQMPIGCLHHPGRWIWQMCHHGLFG